MSLVIKLSKNICHLNEYVKYDHGFSKINRDLIKRIYINNK